MYQYCCLNRNTFDHKYHDEMLYLEKIDTHQRSDHTAEKTFYYRAVSQ